MFSANNFWAGWFHQLRVNIFVIFLQILAGCLHHLPEAITNHMNCICCGRKCTDSMILVERTCDWNVETKNGESGESLKRSSCTCNVFFCVNFLMSTSFGKNVLTRVEYSQYKLFLKRFLWKEGEPWLIKTYRSSDCSNREKIIIWTKRLFESQIDDDGDDDDDLCVLGAKGKVRPRVWECAGRPTTLLLL